MSRRHDEGVEFELPFLRFYAGQRGVRIGTPGDGEDVIDMEMDEEREYRMVRRRVRARLRFFRHVFFFVSLNSLFVLLDWLTGGSGAGINWAQWVALVWGVILSWEFTSTFLAPALWGRDAEERLIQRELRRRRDA